MTYAQHSSRRKQGLWEEKTGEDTSKGTQEKRTIVKRERDGQETEEREEMRERDRRSIVEMING